jgi:hypothetical protein
LYFSESGSFSDGGDPVEDLLFTIPLQVYLVLIQKWWILVQAKAAAISQPEA